jgi:hypothetical protein
MNNTQGSVEAKHGKKMIEVTVRFWVNDIAKEKGKIIPKECRDSGMVRITANQFHGIKAESPTPFNSLMQLTAIIEKVLMASRIKLHHSNRSSKYYKCP